MLTAVILFPAESYEAAPLMQTAIWNILQLLLWLLLLLFATTAALSASRNLFARKRWPIVGSTLTKALVWNAIQRLHQNHLFQSPLQLVFGQTKEITFADLNRLAAEIANVLNLPFEAIPVINIDNDRSTADNTVVQFGIENVQREDGSTVDPIAAAKELLSLVQSKDS